MLNPPVLERHSKGFLRSMPAAVVTMGIGGCWFLWKVAHLPEADFGNYSNWLLLLFGGTLLGSFFFVRDFLAVRGAAIIAMMISNEWLKLAFGEYELPQRLWLVSLVYVVIIVAIYLGTVPFKLRDFLDWFFADARRPRVLGALLTLYGGILLVTALSYL